MHFPLAQSLLRTQKYPEGAPSQAPDEQNRPTGVCETPHWLSGFVQSTLPQGTVVSWPEIRAEQVCHNGHTFPHEPQLFTSELRL
jgi:hypothetical protein